VKDILPIYLWMQEQRRARFDVEFGKIKSLRKPSEVVGIAFSKFMVGIT
jgi:hypothetical protein